MPNGLSYYWYETTYFVTNFACTFGLSMRTTGRKNIPPAGPVLLAANHQSFLDPPLVALSCRRHLCFLARKTLYKNRLFGQLLSSLNSVPVDQEGVAKEGLKNILAKLKEGNAVLIFPEGSRTPDGRMHPFRAGVHLLAQRSEATIVPVGIAGAYDAWPIWRKYPIPAPLFFPPTSRTVAVCMGQPVPWQEFSSLSRAQFSEKLFLLVKAEADRAERLRRK